MRLRLEENFDRFNFAIHKEKEMVSFRRIVLAMAVLALFVGLAGAQVGTGTGSVSSGPLSCTAFVSVPPTLRAEGLTELIGDIVIQCTGINTPLVGGAVVPTANFTVSLGTNVTSRLLSSGSEALLLIDEPGTGEIGAGPSEPILVCSSVSQGAGAGGCATQVGNVITPGGPTTAACLSSNFTAANSVCPAITAAAGGNTSVPNAFQGIVNGNQVTFNGVPVLAPTTGGLTRVFRITNVRANVAGLGGGGLPGTTQLLASVSISGSTALPVSNPVQIAGFVQSGLAARVRNSGNSGSSTLSFAQCNNAGTTGSAGPAPVALLEFKENFATAFKTRVATTSTYNGAGIGVSSSSGSVGFAQGTPAVNYNSESGLIISTPNGTAGLADFGTRLKAVFNNIPAGVTIWVSTTNIVGNNQAANAATTVASTAVTNGGVSPVVAVQVPSEIGTNFAGLTPPGTTFNGASLATVPIVNGSGEAVWEVVQANPAAQDVVQFGMLVTFTGNQATGTPAASTSTAQPVVNLSYAPTATPNTFTTTAGGAASSSLPIPRFQDTSTAANILSITLCQTDLLFPFVTNINGFDTGIAVANTTTDPFGTTAQAGTCTFNFYGSGAPTPVTTPIVATGTDYANTASTIAPGFQGYMIAVCNFQYAHGFAFISDVGARNLAMGYLPLILNNGAAAFAGGRGQSAESLHALSVEVGAIRIQHRAQEAKRRAI
jgi:hypothetical protein